MICNFRFPIHDYITTSLNINKQHISLILCLLLINVLQINRNFFHHSFRYKNIFFVFVRVQCYYAHSWKPILLNKRATLQDNRDRFSRSVGKTMVSIKVHLLIVIHDEEKRGSSPKCSWFRPQWGNGNVLGNRQLSADNI